MRAVSKSALWWGIVRTSPCIVNDAGRDVAQIRPTWTAADFNRVVEDLDPGFIAPIHVLLAGHLRIGELVGLNAGHYSYSTGKISVPKQYSGQNTKTGQYGDSRLFDSCLGAMIDYPDHGGGAAHRPSPSSSVP